MENTLRFVYVVIVCRFLLISATAESRGICYKRTEINNEVVFPKFDCGPQDIFCRTGRKSINQWVSKKGFVSYCCPGYREVFRYSNYLLCQPICDPPCINGFCNLPNKCMCSNGFKLSTDNRTCLFDEYNYVEDKFAASYQSRDGSIEASVIDKTHRIRRSLADLVFNSKCVNGFIKNDQCICFNGYIKYNETDKNGNQACVANCSIPCENADCILPNVCECHPGYLKDSSNRCKPICYRKCVTGYCAEPNLCRTETPKLKCDHETNATACKDVSAECKMFAPDQQFINRSFSSSDQSVDCFLFDRQIEYFTDKCTAKISCYEELFNANKSALLSEINIDYLYEELDVPNEVFLKNIKARNNFDKFFDNKLFNINPCRLCFCSEYRKYCENRNNSEIKIKFNLCSCDNPILGKDWPNTTEASRFTDNTFEDIFDTGICIFILTAVVSFIFLILLGSFVYILIKKVCKKENHHVTVAFNNELYEVNLNVENEYAEIKE